MDTPCECSDNESDLDNEQIEDSDPDSDPYSEPDSDSNGNNEEMSPCMHGELYTFILLANEDQHIAVSVWIDIMPADDSEETGPGIDKDIKLYNNARLTMKTSRILIQKFLLRHHLSDAAKSDLLKIIELHCPKPNNCYITNYQFQKGCSNLLSSITMHQFCTQCLQEVQEEDNTCVNCHQNITQKNSRSYFLKMCVEEQLQTFFASMPTDCKYEMFMWCETAY